MICFAQHIHVVIAVTQYQYITFQANLNINVRRIVNTLDGITKVVIN